MFIALNVKRENSTLASRHELSGYILMVTKIVCRSFGAFVQIQRRAKNQEETIKMSPLFSYMFGQDCV